MASTWDLEHPNEYLNGRRRLVIYSRCARVTVKGVDGMAVQEIAHGRVSLPRWTKPRKKPTKLTSLRAAVLADAAQPGTGEAAGRPTISELSELWVANPGAMRQLEDSYLTCQRLLTDAERLQGDEHILSPIRAALELGRRRQGANGAAGKQAMSDILDDGAKHAAEYVSERAERSARRSYARGLVSGSFVIVVLLSLIAIGIGGMYGMASGNGWTSIDRDISVALRDALACVIGGVTGASLSVLLRLSQIEHLDYRTIDKSAARYRLAIGSLFAAAMVALIKGGILSAVFVDPSAPLIDGADVSVGARVTSFFWWVGIGLVAGFNERWARNLLSRDPTDVDRAKSPPR